MYPRQGQQYQGKRRYSCQDQLLEKQSKIESTAACWSKRVLGTRRTYGHSIKHSVLTDTSAFQTKEVLFRFRHRNVSTLEGGSKRIEEWESDWILPPTYLRYRIRCGDLAGVPNRPCAI